MNKLKTIALGLLLGFTTYAVAEPAATASTSTPPPIEQTAIHTQTAITNQVNINTASVAELQDKLVGIGEKKAQAIIDYRTKHGSFLSVEQLSEVSGIGKSILDKNKDRIVLQ